MRHIKSLFCGKSDSTFVQFFRYLFVGGFSTVVHYGVLIALTELLHLDPNISNLFGFTVGLILTYVLSNIWVFSESRVKNRAAEFTVFTIIGIVGLGINQFFIWLFNNPLKDAAAFEGIFNGLIPVDKYYIIGQVIATGVAFIWNFAARKFILYSRKKKDD